MLGALMIQGITPGPRMLSSHPDLFWCLVASMWIGNLFLVILNVPLIGLWVSMLKIPYRWLCPIILVLSCIGIYTINRSAIDVWLMVLFGGLGYVFLKLECEPAPFVLGFLLGPLFEVNFRRVMLLSRGDLDIFVTHPISAGFLLATLALLVSLVVPAIRKKRTRPSPNPNSSGGGHGCWAPVPHGQWKTTTFAGHPQGGQHDGSSKVLDGAMLRAAFLDNTTARAEVGQWEATALGVDTFTPSERQNYFAAAGYDREWFSPSCGGGPIQRGRISGSWAGNPATSDQTRFLTADHIIRL